MALTTFNDAAANDDHRSYDLLDLSSELFQISTVEGHMLRVNRAWRDTLGYDEAEQRRMLVLDIVDPRHEPTFTETVGAAVTSGQTQSFTSVLLARGGDRIPVRGKLDYRQAGDEPALIYCAMTDLRHELALTAARDEVEQQFLAAFNSPAIGMAIQELDGRWRAVNEALAGILGYSTGELIQMTFHDVTHPDDLDTNIEQLQRLLIGESRWFQMDKRYIHRDGSEIQAILTVSLVTDADGNPLRFLSQVQDVTARRQLETRLLHKASHDALTGLPNREMFMDRLDHALARNHRDGGQIAVMFLDLDGFKSVNDEFGHHQGDKLLVEIGRRLRACARVGDTVARLGGDEFTVLLEQVSHASIANQIAERVRSTLSYPVMLGDMITTITPSIGIAISTAMDDRADALLHDADAAMYAAKRAGKNRIVISDRQT